MTEERKIDFDREVVDGFGVPITILATDGPKECPIIGYENNDKEYISAWTESGQFDLSGKSQWDLIQATDAPLSEFGRKRRMLEAAGELLEALKLAKDALNRAVSSEGYTVGKALECRVAIKASEDAIAKAEDMTDE